MKKTIYLCLCAIMALFFAPDAKAQHIVSATAYPACWSALDSGMVTESGYASGDSIRVYFGDGTWETDNPFYVTGTTAYYSYSHIYSTAGTYTVTIYLYSGGAIVDSTTTTITWVPCYWLYATLYNDVNSSCSLDGGDSYIPSSSLVEIDSAGVPIDTVSATSYVYHRATGPTGTVYQFKVISSPYGYIATCPSSGIATFTITTMAGLYYDTLGFECNPSACIDNSLIGWFRAGVTGAGAHMLVSSSSCTAATATLKLTFSPKYTFDHMYGGSSYSVSGNVVTINLTGLSDLTPQWLHVYFTPVGTLTLGDTANTRMYLVPASGECDTTNNIIISVDTIRSSWDPNAKTVQPEGMISAGQTLTYTLGFENTGNAPAQNIHIMDTLSDNLDISTIKILSSSAYCRMILTTWAGHNVVKFDFPNIHLLDSSHHGQCDGEVVFSIKAKTPLAPGTTIDNKAGIYFDINAAVMTNNVENRIGVTTAVQKIANALVEVYPNPVTDKLNVKSESGLYNTLTITNTMGQQISTQVVNAATTTVDVHSLPAGIYYLQMKGDNGVKTLRFEKL